MEIQKSKDFRKLWVKEKKKKYTERQTFWKKKKKTYKKQTNIKI